MENATKALLIAAAIIIAVVLITITVAVLGQGSTMVQENSDMTGVQVSAYNSEFEAYIGDRVTGSKVKQLINTINQHNRNAEDDSKKIELTAAELITGTTDGTYKTSTNFKVGHTYKVQIDPSKGAKQGYTTTGLIAGIKFETNDTTGE